MTALVTRPLTATDHDQWYELFREYRSFCGREHDPAVMAEVWGWLMDPDHQVRGVAAVAGDLVAGIAHFRSFSRTVDANEGLHLDDLYIAHDFRGNGAARTLLEEIGDVARDESAEFVRWVTARDNTDAQRLYDGVADRTSWVTYEHSPADPAQDAQRLLHAIAS